MPVQIGSGGVIYKIYKKYGNVFPHVTLSANNYFLDRDNCKPENVFSWGVENTFSSNANSNGFFESINFTFEKPFILTAYRMQMSPNFRFQKAWKVETQYKDSPYKLVHSSEEEICTKRLSNPSCDCGVFSEKLFILDKIYKCDKIMITATDADTKGTYSLTVGAIEFYEKHISNCTKFTTSSLNLIQFILIILIK